MNGLEKYLLEFGFGWVMSKLTPFFIILAVSVAIAIFQNRWKTKWRLLNWSRIVLICTLPCLLYFGFYPIYRGDLLDYSENIEDSYVFPKGKCLNILVLKGCPYCKKTVEFTSMLMERNPNWHINYIVIGTKNEYKGFIEEVDPRCKVLYESGTKKIQNITKGSYPTYILSENGKAQKKWSNMHFGYRSLDLIENFLEDK